MKRIATAGCIALVTVAWATRPVSAENEQRRKQLRQFGEEAVYVIEGGRNPPPDYKHSDRYDADTGIAKNSAIADSVYLNRVLLANLLSSDDTRFSADLAKIGKTLEAGKLMQSGLDYDVNYRIPLAIPETASDTCTGACEVALRACTEKDKITKPLPWKERMCIYDKFRHDLEDTIRAMITTKVESSKLRLWGDQENGKPAKVSPYMVIALGTPVSFYSHNPKKPLGYVFDAKRGGAGNECHDRYDATKLEVVPGSREYACSDFDLKIYSPDLTYLFLQSVLPEGKLDSYLREDNKERRRPMLREIQSMMSLNMGVVDSGKRHVFKNNVKDGKGVYQVFPKLAEFVEKWTNAFGREVDIKLEFTFATPAYVNLPNGPIAVVQVKDPEPVENVLAEHDKDEYEGWLQDQLRESYEDL